MDIFIPTTFLSQRLLKQGEFRKSRSKFLSVLVCIVMIRFSAQDAKFLGNAQTGEEALIKDMAIFYGAQYF